MVDLKAVGDGAHPVLVSYAMSKTSAIAYSDDGIASVVGTSDHPAAVFINHSPEEPCNRWLSFSHLQLQSGGRLTD